jgi:hypothetical protein
MLRWQESTLPMIVVRVEACWFVCLQNLQGYAVWKHCAADILGRGSDLRSRRILVLLKALLAVLPAFPCN